MTSQQAWKIQFENELDQAEIARLSGNEGKARVCARRAAGIVVEEYLRRQGRSLTTGNAIEHMKYLAEQQELSPFIREAALHFMLRVSLEHNLPGDVDLIDDARWLAAQLLQE